MPTMPRTNNKATKIAWKLLGKPLAFQKDKKDAKRSQIEKRLVFEETARVR